VRRASRALPVLAVVLLMQTGTAALGQTSPPPMRPFENVELRFAVALPADCRHEEGPGTLEAICAADFDPARSRDAAAASAILLEVDADPVPADARPYDGEAFKSDLAESVCGEAGLDRIATRDIAETPSGAATVFSATVVCPEIKFLVLPTRNADVKVLIYPRFRYRLIARWPSDASAAAGLVKDAFFASFRTTAGEAQ
jgi:hypothetical protein